MLITPTKMTMTSTTPNLTISCPGKVLIAGGYAVLERPNQGLVLGTTANFHSSIQWKHGDSTNDGELRINVISPQFQQMIHMKMNNKNEIQWIGGNHNSYIEQSVAHAVHAALWLENIRNDVQGLQSFLNEIESKSMEDTVRVFDLHMTFELTDFEIGNMRVSHESLPNVCKILGGAKYLRLSNEQTFKLFGEHHRSYLKDDALNGDIHEILVEFVSVGLSGMTGVEHVVVQASRAAWCISNGDTNEQTFRPYYLGMASEGYELEITVRADNDFYSQQSHLEDLKLPFNTASLRSLPQFLPCVDRSGNVQVSKTGLGSSAAMVTSLVGCLVKYLVPDMRQHVSSCLTFIHSCAQLVHAVIQGKIGSGFDVCAAVFGSIRYVRYDEQLFKTAMDYCSVPSKIVNVVQVPTGDMLFDCYLKLNHKIGSLKLPPRLELVCGDIRGGSETPSMSRNILKWKSAGVNLHLWTSLIKNNDSLGVYLTDLAKFACRNTEAYNEALDKCADTKPDDWVGDDSVIALLIKIRNLFYEIRKGLREIGQLADVPVEPLCQTVLCDATMTLPGVLMCGVPGAGGFDAIFSVVIDKSRPAVEQYWSESESKVCALLLSEDHGGLSMRIC